MKRNSIIITFLVLIVLIGVTYFLFNSKANYFCGSSELTSKLPSNYGSVKIIEIDKNICLGEESKFRSLSTQVTGYASATYETPDGKYFLIISQFTNELDALVVAEYLKQDSLRSSQLTLKEFGQNEIVWSLNDGRVVGSFWKSNNNLITIDNLGNENIDDELITSLLTNFPSSNDIVINS